MKKKFDIKSTLAVPTRQLTPEQVDLATRQIHQNSEPAPPAPEVKPPAAAERKPKPQPAEKKPKLERVEKLEIVAEPNAIYQKSAPTKSPSAKNAAIKKAVPPAPPAKATRRETGEKKVRLSVDVLPHIHKQLKLRAVENDTDVMHYVEWLIERELLAG